MFLFIALFYQETNEFSKELKGISSSDDVHILFLTFLYNWISKILSFNTFVEMDLSLNLI